MNNLIARLMSERGQLNVSSGVGIVVVILIVLIFLVVAGFISFD